MDEKLEQFVALLRRPMPGAALAVSAAPRRAPIVVLPGRVIRVPEFQLPEIRIRLPQFRLRDMRLPVPSQGIWAGVGCGAAAVLILGVALWAPLPNQPPAAAPAPAPQAAAPEAAPETAPAPPMIAKLDPPSPPPAAEPEPEEEGEMTAPDPADTADAAEPPAPEPEAAPASRETSVAALPPPLPQGRPGEPAWLRFAVPAPAAHGHPRIAIVIDDLGLDKRRTRHVIALPGPLTLSFIAYATDLPRLTEAARRAGHELLLHVPMEPINHAEDMGPNGLAVSLDHEEVLRRLRWDLARFDGYVGINNHMGSRFTRDAASMRPVIEELKARGLLFLDSRTIGNSAGVELARRYGVPNAARDVFLDNENNAAAVAARLAELEQVARRHGSAIAIGHPHDATLQQLSAWLASLTEKGFILVPVSAVVREHWQIAGESG